MLSYTPRNTAKYRENVKGLHQSQSNETGTSFLLFARFGILGLFPFSFFLSGYVKGKLMEYRAETPSELLVRIRVILAEIPRETLNAVFLEWVERLQNACR
jgi:hypothetical protein